MSKGMTCKDAIKFWEDKTGQKASEADTVKLLMMIPPIIKLDAALSTLSNCTQLSLSTNQIEKISNLNGLPHLEVLSLGRNNIKKLENFEPVAETLKELWISYNLIEKLHGIEVLKNLKVLFMSNNKVKAWDEFERLRELPALEDLLFVGNPLEEKHTLEGNYRDEVIKRLPKLKKLDGKPIIKDDEVEEEEGGGAAPPA